MDKRVQILVDNEISGNTLYIMRRDLRLEHNYCIPYAYSLSNSCKSKLYILVPYYEFELNARQKNFVMEGIDELSKQCKNLNIYFAITDDVFKHIIDFEIKNIVLDYNPLRNSLIFDDKVTSYCNDKTLFCAQIDAHNIVPHTCLDVYKRTSKSVKIALFKEYSKYCVDFEEVTKHQYNDKTEVENFDSNIKDYSGDKYFKGGHLAGIKVFHEFLDSKFKLFAKERNNPDMDVLSGLSPYINFGFVSSQYVIKYVCDRYKDSNAEFFVNEMFVWKETAEHFCYHEKSYDSLDGALEWARRSLESHRSDKRPHIYTRDELENARTEEDLWNAAQTQLVIYGKMHGYVRMYWAKQLLKWTKSPKEALSLAIEFNDKYSIDGFDAKGYVGIMWCICGTMDQGFKDRPITGKIRPMNPIKTKVYSDRWNNKKKYESYLKSLEVSR